MQQAPSACLVLPHFQIDSNMLQEINEDIQRNSLESSVFAGQKTGRKRFHGRVLIKITLKSSVIISENVAEMDAMLRADHPTA